MCKKQPFLGASPYAYAFDPSGTDPYGLIEIKCPFKYCDHHPEGASNFFCTLSTKDGRQLVELKHILCPGIGSACYHRMIMM